MKPHMHAVVSLGYGAAVSLILHGSLLNTPDIYLAALFGGETIDIIDHTLYHLVYRRNEPVVVEARKILIEKGVAAFFRFVFRVEDLRGFSNLLLHNIYGLLVTIILLACLSILMPWSLFAILFVSSTLLHMLTDLLWDIHIYGNVDHWLWVLPPKIKPQSEKAPKNRPILAGHLRG